MPLGLGQFVQPLKPEPPPGVAVNTTLVPDGYEAVHVGPQFMPAGVLVTVPVPAPDFVTLSGQVNIATGFLGAFIVTEHKFPAIPSQPVQVPKLAPAAGLAVKVMDEPALNEVVHVPGQLIPPGELVIEPPEPFAIVAVNG